MSLRRFLLPAVLVSFLTSGASALEWEVDSLTSVAMGNQPSPPNAGISETLQGSLQVPFDLKGGGFDLKAHTTGTLLPVAGSTDFDVLSVTFVYTQPAPDLNTLKWTLGRFSMTEPTGLILIHPGDGFKLDFDYGVVDLGVYLGYTGLVNRTSSQISLSLDDENNAQNWFASPRLIGSVQAQTKLFGEHRFTFDLLAQRDLNPSSQLIASGTLWPATQSSTGGTLDTEYITLDAQGPVVERLFYHTFGTFGAGSTLSLINGYDYEYKPVIAFLGGGSLSYFVPDWLNASFEGRIVAASGDGAASSVVEGNTKDFSSIFLPITPTTLGVVFSPGLSNLIYYELGGTVKPIPGQTLVTGAKLLGFQRAVAGVVNSPGVVGNGPVWLGEELDLTASWVPWSDLTLLASLGGFFPTAGTYVSGATGDGFQYSLQISAKLSL